MSIQPGPSTEVETRREYSRQRTSDVLRSILVKNPGVRAFTVERILDAIGQERFEASLMMFSIPALVPMSAPRGIVSLPLGLAGCQMVSGRAQIRLPRSVLRKSVSRRSLAVAIHAIVPILEAAERLVRPRWSWVTNAVARRAIGMLVFLLAVAIAYPLVGGNSLHALSVFVVSLGLAEQDGLAVLIGLVAGVTSLALVAASGWSLRTMGVKLRDAMRKVARKLGMTTLTRFLERLGLGRLGRLLNVDLPDLLLLWDPERRYAPQAETAMTSARKAPSASPRAMHEVAPWTRRAPRRGGSSTSVTTQLRAAGTSPPPWISKPQRAA